MTDVAANWAGRVGKFAGGLYDFAVEREALARPAGVVMWGTDTRLLFDAIATIGGLPDGAAVLDIPCGGGLALRGLRPQQRVRYVAADISGDMLMRAQRRAVALGRTDIEFVTADIGRMPFSDGEFDCCVSFNGLHCVPDPGAAVSELARCLKPGGRLLGDAVVRKTSWRQDALIAAFQRTGVFGPGGTADELRHWLTDAGFVVERFQRSGAVIHFTAVRG